MPPEHPRVAVPRPQRQCRPHVLPAPCSPTPSACIECSSSRSSPALSSCRSSIGLPYSTPQVMCSFAHLPASNRHNVDLASSPPTLSPLRAESNPEGITEGIITLSV